MKSKARWGILLGAGVCLLAYLSVVRVGPDEIGVLTENFVGESSGIVRQDFGPGWHLGLPWLHTWHLVSSHVRRVELTKDPRHRSPLGADALLVQSREGDRVMIDIDVFFRVVPGQAHRLLQDSGTGDGHVAVLRSLAQDRLRSVFGSLGTEEFYDATAREKKTKEAFEALSEVCRTRFIEVVSIQVLDMEFEPKYEQKIEQKKLADQAVELNKAQTRAEAERATVNAIRLLTTRKTQLIETNAAAEAARIAAEARKDAAKEHADADLYRQDRQAEGNLAQALAEAKVKQAKADALKESAGANLAALEAVKNLRIDAIAFPTSNVEWFDVHRMAVRLGAKP